MIEEKTNLKRRWTEEEERFLGETIVKYIESGDTIGNAIKKISKDLNRTQAACRFRWHKVIQFRFKASLEIAREQGKKNTPIEEESMSKTESINFESPFVGFTQNLDSILQQIYQLQNELRYLEERYSEKNQLVQMLTEENNRIKRENNNLQNQLDQVDKRSLAITKDYKTMIEILNRARQMSLVPDSNTQAFQMDLNGNLQRIRKQLK